MTNKDAAVTGVACCVGVVAGLAFGVGLILFTLGYYITVVRPPVG